MKTIKHIIPVLAIFIIISACNRIDEGDYTVPYKIEADSKKTVLLEDFTGAHCTNCPQATGFIKSLQDENNLGARLIAVAIHTPLDLMPQGSEDTMVCEAGRYYYNKFGKAGTLPVGTINRTKNGDFFYFDRNDWTSKALSFATATQEVDLEITKIVEENRELTIKVNAGLRVDLDGSYSLVVLLTEDSVVHPQSISRSEVDPYYVHNHVLRDNITHVDGETLFSGSSSEGDQETSTFTYTVPERFRIEHCHLVAYLYNEETMEVLQAAEKKIVASGASESE